MLEEEKLDRFLDAFLENKRPQQPVDTDFRDSEAAAQPEDSVFAQAQQILVAPLHKGKLTKRTIVSIFIILLLIPLTIWVGINVFGDRKYLVISLVILVFSMLPFFMVFEGRKPKARELMIISVMTALAVASRAVLFAFPSFKPVETFAILTGVCFGAESGFLVGSLTMLSSNMLFGQGPWTPWQMFSAGIIGFLAGILYQKGWLKASRWSLCVYGFLTTVFIYGGIMNPAALVMSSYAINWKNLLAIYISGVPVDLVHALANVLCLWFISQPMLEKLERIKVKYGLIE